MPPALLLVEEVMGAVPAGDMAPPPRNACLLPREGPTSGPILITMLSLAAAAPAEGPAAPIAPDVLLLEAAWLAVVLLLGMLPDPMLLRRAAPAALNGCGCCWRLRGEAVSTDLRPAPCTAIAQDRTA